MLVDVVLSRCSVGERMDFFISVDQLLVLVCVDMLPTGLSPRCDFFFFGMGFHYRPGKALRHPKTDLVSPRPTMRFLLRMRLKQIRR